MLEVGAQLPAHASALGKAMLAYAPEPVLAELFAEPLPKLTNRTLTAKALRAQLEEVRESGIARERDEAVLGESSVAAPITDHARHAVGAIGVVGETAELLPRGPAKGVTAAVSEAARASRASSAPGAGRSRARPVRALAPRQSLSAARPDDESGWSQSAALPLSSSARRGVPPAGITTAKRCCRFASRSDSS